MASRNPFIRFLERREAEERNHKEEEAAKHIDTSQPGADGHATTETPPPDPNASVSNVIAQDEQTEIVRLRNTIVDHDAITDTGKAATDGGGSTNAAGGTLTPEQTQIIPGRGLPHTIVDHDAVTDTGPASTDVGVPATGEGTAIIPGRGLPHTIVDHDAVTDTGKATGGTTETGSTGSTGSTTAELKAELDREADLFQHGFTSEVERIEKAVLDGDPVGALHGSVVAPPGTDLGTVAGSGVAKGVVTGALGSGVGGGALGGFATIPTIVGSGILAGGLLVGGTLIGGAASSVVDHLTSDDKKPDDDSSSSHTVDRGKDDDSGSPFNPFGGSGNSDDDKDPPEGNSGGNSTAPGTDSDPQNNTSPDPSSGSNSGSDGTGGEDFQNQNSTNPDPSADDGQTLGQSQNGDNSSSAPASDPATSGTAPGTDDTGGTPATQGEDTDNQQSVGPDPNDDRDQSLGTPDTPSDPATQGEDVDNQQSVGPDPNDNRNQSLGTTDGTDTNPPADTGDGSGGEDPDTQKSTEPDPTDPNGTSIGQVDNGDDSDDDNPQSTPPANNEDADQSQNDAGGGVAMEGDPGNPATDDGSGRAPALDAFQRALAGLGVGPVNHNQSSPDTNPDADQSGFTGGTPTNATIGHTIHGNLGDPGQPGVDEGSHPVGGVPAGSVLPGHTGGEPGDAQSGIVQDDGLGVHGHAKDDGPSNVQFGPGGGALATPPSAAQPAQDPPPDNSNNGTVISIHNDVAPIQHKFDVPTPHDPHHQPAIGEHFALGAPASSSSSDDQSSSTDDDSSGSGTTLPVDEGLTLHEAVHIPHLTLASDDDN